MAEAIPSKNRNLFAAVLIAAAVSMLYAFVLTKLGRDWWSDENYSHGLLVPWVIGFIVWREWDALTAMAASGRKVLGSGMVISAFLMLTAGTLGSELFTQRISFVLMLVAIVIYLAGAHVLRILSVPIALLLLSIPIPQILFNRIAFPLQLWASQLAVWGIRLFEVPTLRKGNVIDILPKGATQTISLEVVEACSGIRSMMTLVTLSLILTYFTRRGAGPFSGKDWIRALVLMAAAVPTAVITNGARVAVTGILTFYYGKQATEGTWHDASGWLVYVVALALLLAANFLLSKFFSSDFGTRRYTSEARRVPYLRLSGIGPLFISLVLGALLVNWFVARGELVPERVPLSTLNTKLGDWSQKGSEIRFDESIETVLKVTDYTMREYTLADGRLANLYVGYYASQRSGATYHSPQNCLPGAGWVMTEPQTVEIEGPKGAFKANRYIIENGPYREVMIYWYQGRGRTEASEYSDKVNTVWDSVNRRRSDGAMVRVMTSVGTDENAAIAAAIDLSSSLSRELGSFIPE